MSTPAGLSIPHPKQAMARRNSLQRMTDSGEIDVFEAERYFSAATENLSSSTTTIPLPHKFEVIRAKESEPYDKTSNSRQLRQGRSSLDLPRITTHTLPNPQHILLDHHHNTIKKPIKHKKQQPTSPGGKLASFFNSLINQTVSKKNKSSKSGSQSVKSRRSSISTLTTTTNSTKTTTISDSDTKSIQSCSSLVSGFRTPPPYKISTPIKPFKEFKNAISTISIATAPKLNSSAPNFDWLDQKFKIVNSSSKDFEKRVNFGDRNHEAEVFKRFMEEDGADSDSSSDLFELRLSKDHHHYHLKHQLGYCANDLPVYESTRVDTIKISSGAPITNGPFRN